MNESSQTPNVFYKYVEQLSIPGNWPLNSYFHPLNLCGQEPARDWWVRVCVSLALLIKKWIVKFLALDEATNLKDK